MKDNLKSLQILTNDQKRNIVLALLLLLMPVIGNFFFIEDFVTDYIRKSNLARKISANTIKINENSILFDMLEEVSDNDYEPKVITLGVNPKNLDGYFSYYAYILAKNLEDERLAYEKAMAEAAAAAAAAAKSKTTAVVTQTQTPQVVVKTPGKSASYPNAVSYIYEGGNSSFVIIDGKLLKLGDITKSGMKVIKIESNKVLLQDKRSSEWVILKF